MTQRIISATAPKISTLATVAEKARQARDNKQSVKAFNKTIDAYVKTIATTEMAQEVYNLYATELRQSKALVAAAKDALGDVYPSVPAMTPAELIAFNKKENVSDGEHRGFIWDMIHNMTRVDTFDMLLDDNIYDKKMSKFSNRFRAMIKALLVEQMSSKDSTCLAQAIIPKIGRLLPHGIKDADMKTVATIVMIQMYTIAQTPLVKAEVFTDMETNAKTHRFTLNIVVSDEIKEAMNRVKKRGILFTAPKEYETGSTHNVVSKRSWRDYKDAPLSKDMAEMYNIRNQMPLSLKESDNFNNELYDALTKKFGIDLGDPEFVKTLGKTSYDKLVWTTTARNNALQEAKDIMFNGNKFYIEHFSDRVHRNYEKSEYFGMGQHKALRELVELYNKKPLDATGRDAVRLDIAASMGYDKCSQAEAMTAFNKHSKEWRTLPELAERFTLLRSKKAVGTLIEQDATNSGTQMYAIGTRDANLGMICGLFGEERFDAYGLLADKLNKSLDTDKFNRTNVKSLFMTTLYNAGKKLMLWGGDTTKDENGESVLEQVAKYNDGDKLVPLMHTVPEMDEAVVWEAFTKAMMSLAPRAMQVMSRIKGLIDDRTMYEWTMPDGAVCQTAMTKVVDVDVQWRTSDNKKHSMKMQHKVVEAEAKWRALAPAIIQGMDAYVLRELTRRAYAEGIEVVTLHDAFFSHANDTVRVRELYREVLVDAMDMDILSDVYNQLSNRPAITLQAGKMTNEDVANSVYALWA